MPDIDDYDDDESAGGGTYRNAEFDDPDTDEDLDDLDDFDEDEDPDEE